MRLTTKVGIVAVASRKGRERREVEAQENAKRQQQKNAKIEDQVYELCSDREQSKAFFAGVKQGIEETTARFTQDLDEMHVRKPGPISRFMKGAEECEKIYQERDQKMHKVMDKEWKKHIQPELDAWDDYSPHIAEIAIKLNGGADISDLHEMGRLAGAKYVAEEVDGYVQNKFDTGQVSSIGALIIGKTTAKEDTVDNFSNELNDLNKEIKQRLKSYKKAEKSGMQQSQAKPSQVQPAKPKNPKFG